jgi:hypothetical protein
MLARPDIQELRQRCLSYALSHMAELDLTPLRRLPPVIALDLLLACQHKEKGAQAVGAPPSFLKVGDFTLYHSCSCSCTLSHYSLLFSSLLLTTPQLDGNQKLLSTWLMPLGTPDQQALASPRGKVPRVPSQRVCTRASSCICISTRTCTSTRVCTCTSAGTLTYESQDVTDNKVRHDTVSGTPRITPRVRLLRESECTYSIRHLILLQDGKDSPRKVDKKEEEKLEKERERLRKEEERMRKEEVLLY